jgi:hypothetical protein
MPALSRRDYTEHSAEVAVCGCRRWICGSGETQLGLNGHFASPVILLVSAVLGLQDLVLILRQTSAYAT